MLIKQDTGFEFLLPANQHRRTSSIWQGIGCDEVFRLGGQIIFLPTTAAQFANLGHIGVQFPVADHQVGDNSAVTNAGDGSRSAA